MDDTHNLEFPNIIFFHRCTLIKPFSLCSISKSMSADYVFLPSKILNQDKHINNIIQVNHCLFKKLSSFNLIMKLFIFLFLQKSWFFVNKSVYPQRYNFSVVFRQNFLFRLILLAFLFPFSFSFCLLLWETP